MVTKGGGSGGAVVLRTPFLGFIEALFRDLMWVLIGF